MLLPVCEIVALGRLRLLLTLSLLASLGLGGCPDIEDHGPLLDAGTDLVADAGPVVVVRPPSFDAGAVLDVDSGAVGGCPACPAHSHCERGSACVCDDGFFPDAAGATCTSAGRRCSAGDAPYCVNGYSVFCDPLNGVSVLDCASFDGVCDGGRCTCGALLRETDPMCIDGASSAHEYKVGCDLRTGYLSLTNCRQFGTQRHCGTLVTQHGHATECWCGPEILYSSSGDRCEPWGGSCTYDAYSSIYACR